MDEQEWLFSGENLDKILERKKQEIVRIVDEISQDKFRNSSEKHLINCVVDKLLVTPIEFKGKCITSEPEEVEIDISNNRILASRQDKYGQPRRGYGIKVHCCIPFKGDDWILNCKHEEHLLLPTIEGKVRAEEICLPVVQEIGELKELFNSKLGEKSELLHSHIECTNKQVKCFNEEVKELLKPKIDEKMELLRSNIKCANDQVGCYNKCLNQLAERAVFDRHQRFSLQ